MTTCTKPVGRLAPRTSSQECAPITQNCFKATFNGFAERRDPGPLMQPLTIFDCHRQQRQIQKLLAILHALFNIHNPSLDHRDRGACASLLTP
jgi:hypothetical protein